MNIFDNIEVATSYGDYYTTDAQNLPFSDNSYSVIASVTMLEFTEDQEAVIKEMHRVLKYEGWLILGCLNSKSVLGMRKEEDEIFKDARLIDSEYLYEKLKYFGEPIFDFSVYLSTDGKLLDNSKDKSEIEPVFFAVKIKKTK